MIGRGEIPPRVRASAAYFAFFAGNGAFIPYAPLFYQSRGLDFQQIGWAISVSALIGLIAAPGWGAIADRLGGSPRVLLLSGAIAVVGVALLATGESFLQIIAGNVVLGVGVTGLLPIIDARALETTGGERSGYGPLRAWGSIGWVVSSFATGLLIQATEIRSIFVILASGLTATAVIALTLRPATPVRAVRPLPATLRIFRAPSFALFLLGAFLAWSAMSAMLDFLTLRFGELGAEASVIGLAWAISAAIEVPVMLGFPSVARRFRPDHVLIAGALILALRSGLTAIAPEPAIIVLASAIGGVGYALFLIGGVTYVSERVPPELAATAQGTLQSISISLSGVVGAASAGLIARESGIQGMFGVATAVGLVGVVVIAFAARPSRARALARRGELA